MLSGTSGCLASLASTGTSLSIELGANKREEKNALDFVDCRLEDRTNSVSTPVLLDQPRHIMGCVPPKVLGLNRRMVILVAASA
jgi:hypothetical protein